MNAVHVIYELLQAHAPLTSIVPADNIEAGVIPAGRMPAVGITEISRIETATASLSEANVLVRARVQVTVYADSYALQKEILQAAKLGPGAHTGIIAGVAVRSVIRGAVGPDLSDHAAGIFEQSRDFTVTYIEQN